MLLMAGVAVLSLTTHAQALKPNPYVECHGSIDPVGCFLNLAKQRALNSKTKKQQVELTGKVLSHLAQLHRTDFDLLSKAATMAEDKTLGIEQYLDLQVALATYFIERDADRADKHLANASKLYWAALDRDRPDDRAILYRWACGLIDQHAMVWRRVSQITASTCTVKRVNQIDSKDLADELVVTLQKMDAAWVQSDFEGLEDQRKFFSSKLAEMEAVGIQRKNKGINEATQYFKVLALLTLADRYRRSSQRVEADKALAQAQEALSGLEKINDGKYALSARVMLADHHNGFLEFTRAKDVLKPLVERFASTQTWSKVDHEDQVDFLLALACAIDVGGFQTRAEAIGSRSERQRRQADVLYERYVILSRLEKSSEVPSQASLRALHDAGEAGHPLAMHNLGVAYSHGLYGLPKSTSKARYWYYWSAISGFAGAQNNLGDLYETAKDAPPDMGMALYWYTQAAMQGEPTAYLSLGDLFFEGNGVAQNDFTAAFWLLLAAEHLPDGQNKAKATKRAEIAVSKLEEKTKRLLYARIHNFAPLKQTRDLIGDKPKVGAPS